MNGEQRTEQRIIEVLQGRADAATERWVVEYRAASPVNEAHFQSLAQVWSRTAPLLQSPPDERSPTVGDLVDRSSARVIQLRVPDSGPPRRWLQLGWAAAAAVLLAVGLAAGSALVRRSTPEMVMESVVTGAGELATVRLDDGSMVRLAPSSSLRVGAPGEREVFVDGRVFLSVVHDEARPFRVRTPLGEALVLGTRFEVEARQGVLQVVVVEGRVRLESESGPVQVGANEVGRLLEGGSVEVTHTDDVLRRVAWIGDYFAFERTPLTQVAVEVGERFGARVEVLDSALAQRTVTGWYAGTSFEQTMEAVCLVVGAYCEIQDSVATVQP